MMPLYRMATYCLDFEYPNGACFLLVLEGFTVSQFSFAAGFVLSVSDKMIGSSASLGVRKSTFVFFVVLFFVGFSVDISMSGSCVSVGLSGRGGSLAASGVIAVILLEMSFGVGVVALVVILVAIALAIVALAMALFAVAVGAKVNLVCCGPCEFVPLAFATLVCLDLSPPRGDASFPFVLVGLRLFF